MAGSENKADAETLTKLMKAMHLNFEAATGRHPRALTVAHDQGLSTENMNGNENMNDDDDNEINQDEHGRPGRMKLTFKDQLIKREVMCFSGRLEMSRCWLKCLLIA